MNQLDEPPDAAEARARLMACLRDDTALLLGTMRIYVQQLGLAQGEEARSVALDVLQEVAIEALAHADRFAPERRPVAWLLGISVNVIRRRKVERAKRMERELSFRHLFAIPGGKPPDESDILDRIIASSASSPEQIVEDDEQVDELLSLVPDEDRDILRLAFLDDFDRNDIAERLGTTPGAARMRLHRALGRLRAAWRAQHADSGKGGDHDA